jgi:transposase-like protein
MSSVEPKPWDGKCPHCGEEKRIYDTGGGIGHLGGSIAFKKVMICTGCNKTFYLFDKTTVMVTLDPV